tara:strand:+ start:950 stop:1120 length:171 start_codon:yes stop_codon:yes gene_type:complete
MIYEINQVFYEKGRTAYRVCIKDADTSELKSERIFRTKEDAKSYIALKKLYKNESL